MIELVSKIAVIEPYAMTALVGFVKEYIMGPPVRSIDGNPAVNYTEFTSKASFEAVVTKHCKYVDLLYY